VVHKLSVIVLTARNKSSNNAENNTAVAAAVNENKQLAIKQGNLTVA